MIPWERLDAADVPGESQPLVLWRRGGEYVIRVGAVALMSSTAHGSEEALAERACAHVAARTGARVLVGGLGMGFTLAAALRVLRADAVVHVAELVPAVVAWNRGALAHLAGRPLEDPRVTAIEGDVGACITGARGTYDAILLDVDNGPGGFTRAGNDALYGAAGLAACRRALTPGGALGVWSVAADAAFERRMAAAGFDVETLAPRSRGGRGGRHTLWIGLARSSG